LVQTETFSRTIKKLATIGAFIFVDRMFEACGNYQWARNFPKNSLESEATKIEFGIEWQAVEKPGVYRRTVADNGIGVTRDVVRFFSTLALRQSSLKRGSTGLVSSRHTSSGARCLRC
jgi:hypothetical protein